MLAKGVKPKDIIERDMMPEDVRDMKNEAFRNMRDWYIYRDYMNGLEYIVQAFTHMATNPKNTFVSGRRRRRRRRGITYY